MPVKMAAHQLAFWQELLSPFPDELLSLTKRGGKELTYVCKRAITNRLDSVCGPNGWSIEYEATARGYKARLGILCPSAREDVWVWHYKEDGAGFEEMGSVNKQTQEFEYDVDNDEKSGYTNACRRAAQDAWGIGRYLYRKGIPTFLDPNAKPFEDQCRGAGQAAPRVQAPPAQSASPAPRAQAQAPPADPTPQAAKQYDNFKIPPPGKSVFAWCKEMERAFETRLFDGMCREGETRGWGKQFAEWDASQVREVCMTAIGHCRELPTYNGQYEYLFPGGSAPAAPVPNTKPGVNIADLRKSLVTKMTALVAKQIGRLPTQTELKSTFEQVASSSANGEGNFGEVPESLAKLTDVKWIGNMLAFTDCQITEAMALPEDETIPF